MNWTAGVIDKTTKPVRLAPGVAATVAFAAALAERYEARPVTVSRVELALAFDAPAQVNYFQHASHITIEPKVTVEQPRPFARVRREMAAAPIQGAEFRAEEAESLFERLFSRRMRVERFAAAREPEPQQPSETSLTSTLRRIAANDGAAVERVFPRARVPESSIAPPAAEVAARPPAQSQEWPSSPTNSMPPKPVTLAAPEIRRVAEQVIREIDHRIIAQRERMRR